MQWGIAQNHEVWARWIRNLRNETAARVLRCYAQLEAVDPRGQKSRELRVDLAAVRAFIEECSRKALEVSLQSENLTNLERARLLDILLWASELFLVLRAPRVTFGDHAASPDTRGAKRMASRF